MKTINFFALAAGLAFTTTPISAQAPAAANKASSQSQNASNSNAIAQALTQTVKQMVTGVTPDQESKILSAEQDYAKGVLDVRNSANPNGSSSDKMAKYNQLESYRTTRDTKIKTILTADQYTQYQKTSPPSATPASAKPQTGK